jgi:molecular chaperone GrpE
MLNQDETPEPPDELDDTANEGSFEDAEASFDDPADVSSGAESGGDSEEIEEAPVFTTSELEERVAAAKGEAQERYLRLLAEYENFRKRTAREREQWAAEAQSDLARDLLPVFDSLDKAAELGADDAAALTEGLAAIRRQLATALEKNAIEVHAPLEEAFDPQFHEALTQQPSADHDPGTVLAVFEKGYTIEGRLLRAARVVVSTKPA